MLLLYDARTTPIVKPLRAFTRGAIDDCKPLLRRVIPGSQSLTFVGRSGTPFPWSGGLKANFAAGHPLSFLPTFHARLSRRVFYAFIYSTRRQEGRSALVPLRYFTIRRCAP